MKAKVSYSGNQKSRGSTRRPFVTIAVEPETEEESAVLRMASVGKRRVYIYESGNAEIHVLMPRAHNNV